MTDTITESLKAIRKFCTQISHDIGCRFAALGIDAHCTCGKISALNELDAIQSTISSAESDAGKVVKSWLEPDCANTFIDDDAEARLVNAITAALLKAASVKAQDETGWLIELAASPPSEPKYWQNGSLWTGDNIKAIRFARKEDAERIAALMLDGMNIRICEHIWTA